MLEVHKMLALSTGHVSWETAAQLDGEASPCICYNKYASGWFIPVPESDLDVNEHVPDDLKEIFAFARQHGYTWLMIDRDADSVDDLPTYEW